MKYRDHRVTRLRLVLAAFVIGLLTVSCGSTVVGEPERASGQEGLFNPCTDIPDSVIEDVGLDPATEEIDISGVEQPGWKICSWTASRYYLIVFANDHTLDEARANPDFGGFKNIQAGTREAVQFHRKDDVEVERCYVGLSIEGGSIWVAVDLMGGETMEEPTCDLAVDYVAKLDGFLPS